jgi:hypothetical protein
MFGERCRSQARATDIGVAPSRAATADSAPDCSGLKPSAQTHMDEVLARREDYDARTS